MSIHNDLSSTRGPTRNDCPQWKVESTRKRKREGGDERAIDRRPFRIRADSSDPFAKPRTFTPLCLLSRSQLPLAYLDTAHHGSRLFAAHVQILEACHGQEEEGPNVLIVEDETEGRIYAMERAQRRKYALCRLVEGVTEDELLGRSTLDVRPLEPRTKRQALQSQDAAKPWWMSASVDMSVKPEILTRPLPRLFMQDSTSVSLSVVRSQEKTTEPPALDDSQLDADTASKPVAPEEALEELARQYLDSLYLSRTPLAYFVKGPLARARAALATNSADLIAFLRGAILSSSVTDKKYRESVSEVIKELPVFETPETKPNSRKRRKWKPKRDKSGFFTDEKDHIEQWWRKEDNTTYNSDSEETLEAVLKRRSMKLRNRETFLQVILILEIMALEASTPPQPLEPANADAQAPEPQAAESQPAAGEKKTRKKKEVDISAILETLLDRLCIWYSLEGITPIQGKSGTAGEEARDDLKDFAVEVIVPFYLSRIHDQASATSKKLGGPSAPSPTKRKSASSKKPGEPAVRQAPEKRPRKPLERASTDTLNHAAKRPPSLHRSATDQDVLAPLIKREQSEQPSLRNIPQARFREQPANPGLRKHVSLLDQQLNSRRQVDFAAMTKASEAKLREREKREKLVRDAVSGIRKPNRGLATEETAKNADESFARAIAKGKASKSQSSQRNNAVAVTATPRHVKATPAPRRRTQANSDDHSGATSIVPASSLKLRAPEPDMAFGSTPAVPRTGHRPRHTSSIEDTPSRGFARYLPPALTRPPGTLLESPTANRTSSYTIAATPLKSLKMPSLTETPIAKPSSALKLKGTRLDTIVDASPDPLVDDRDDSGVAFGGPKHDADDGRLDGGGKSVYDALGWNDDDYEPLG